MRRDVNSLHSTQVFIFTPSTFNSEQDIFGAINVFGFPGKLAGSFK